MAEAPIPGNPQHLLVLASGNSGKLREINALLGPEGFQLRPQSDWDIPEVEENGLSFVENALLKARNACEMSRYPALADDSGLVVPALDGAPGIHSARYAGDKAGDEANNQKLLAAMSSLTGAQRQAYFYCAMVVVRTAADPAPLVATGSWHGTIGDEPRGSGGFGYDPLFLVPEHACSSAQLAPATKNRISHRGQAMQAMIAQLHQLGPNAA